MIRPMITKAYKALRRSLDGHHLQSAESPKSLRVTYEEGIWNEPSLKESKLFCFKTLVEAKSNYGAMAFEIWEIEAENMEKATVMGEPWSVDLIESFWRSGMKEFELEAWGFYYCDKVRLIRRIR